MKTELLLPSLPMPSIISAQHGACLPSLTSFSVEGAADCVPAAWLLATSLAYALK